MGPCSCPAHAPPAVSLAHPPSLAVGGAGGGTGVSKSAGAAERLLIASGKFSPSHPLEGAVLVRMRRRFGVRLLLVLQDGTADELCELYDDAKHLPSVTTVQRFKAEGYTIHELLFTSSTILTCFKGTDEYLLKSGLSEAELRRAVEFKSAVPNPHRGIVPFELRSDVAKGKHFMLMPKLRTSLELIPSLPADDTARLWGDLRGALDFLHTHGFAHMDVKPANICLDWEGRFVLVDLGSLARFGESTSTTPAYVPRDVAWWRSSAGVDWWMLASTLAEKGCGEHALAIGATARSASREQLRDHLRAHLPAGVWSECEAVLQTL